MQNIESTIVELGQIFTQLAHMVKEQEESVQRYVNFKIASSFKKHKCNLNNQEKSIYGSFQHNNRSNISLVENT
jgi:t-SNARE complex subunit (syntaxin)